MVFAVGDRVQWMRGEAYAGRGGMVEEAYPESDYYEVGFDGDEGATSPCFGSDLAPAATPAMEEGK